jgi:hypothetical protein
MRRTGWFAKLLFGVLTLLGGLPGAASASPSDVLGTFQPGVVLAGTWTRQVDESMSLYAASCAGRARTWQAGGIRFVLLWQECAEADRTTYLKSDALTRVQYGNTWSNRSVLKRADVVRPLAGNQVGRSWVQSSYIVMMSSTCGNLTTDQCADLTGRAARYVAQRLPGTPIYHSGLPEPSRLLSGLLIVWGLMVGLVNLSQRVRRQPFAVDPTDTRTRSADVPAARLRRRHRGRRWGQFLLVTGTVVLLAQVLAVFRTGQPISWFAAIACGLLTPAAGVLLLRRCRHPMLGMGWVWGRGLASPFTFRRLASVVLTVLLGVVAVVIPLAALIGAFLLSLVDDDVNGTSRLVAYALILGLALGWLIDRGAQRLRARNAQELMRIDDERPRFLYLRYFGDDDLKLPVTALGRRGLFQILTGWSSIFRRSRFEEIFARATAAYGPVIAIDPPDTRLKNLMSALPVPTRAGVQRMLDATWVSKLGAGKTHLSAESWQADVEQMANEADAVIMAAAPADIRHGLRWEIQMLAERLGHGRVVLVVSPHQQKDMTLANLHRFVAEVARFPMFAPLRNRAVSEGVLVLVHVPNEGWGTWYSWAARYRTAWTYTAAIDEALRFADAAWRRPALAIDPFHGVPPTEVVTAAIVAAAQARPGQPVGTGELLTALARCDGHGRWERIWLQSTERSQEGEARCDPAAEHHIEYRGVLINRTCEQALAASAQLARAYGLVPIPPGILLIGLLNNPYAAAAGRLGITTEEKYEVIREIIETDLLGITLEPGGGRNHHGPPPTA